MEGLLSAEGTSTDQEGPSLLSVGVARVWSLLLAMAAAVEWTVEGHPLWEVIELLCAGTEGGGSTKQTQQQTDDEQQTQEPGAHTNCARCGNAYRMSSGEVTLAAASTGKSTEGTS